MPNIVLTRIDNRLVHGQVATQWCGAIGANLILVANDEVAGNSLRQGLMNMAAPSYASMRYWTIQKTIDTIHKASAKALIIILSPFIFLSSGRYSLNDRAKTRMFKC